MRKVVIYTLLSVDGVAEAPEQFVVEFDDAMAANLADVISAQDTVLLGRVMYDEWAEYWPTAIEPPFTDFINSVQKYVATSSPLTTSWTGAEPIDGPVTDFVRELKGRPGADIGVHGSIALAQSLLTAGLVDELRLVIAPTFVGSGRRLFDPIGVPPRLELIDSSSAPSGALLVGYRVTGSD